MVTAIEQLDKSKGLRLVAGDGSDARATRYLFMAGDIIPPERKDPLAGGLEHLQPGGAEVEARCLRRTPNFIPRATLTPLELWPNPMPREFLPEGFPEELLLQVEGEDDPFNAPLRASARVLQGRALVGYPVFPGHDVNSILAERTGIVQIPALQGIDWDSGSAQRLQQEFFPTSAPYELSKLRQQIESRASIDRGVAHAMASSCDLFSRWATTRLRVEHTLLQQRVSTNGQFIFTYSPLAAQLLAQLEMTPQDQGFQHLMAQSQRMIADAIASQGAPQQGVTPDLVASIVKAVMDATAPPKTIEEVKAEAPAKKTPKKDGNTQ